jgi:NADPH-dependent 2,4-dienoyl-CoA reductase/sulfur reductase-like enzyme
MKRNFQVLVVGSGPAGIAAAVCAAENGMNVGLLDDNPAPGGQIWRSGTKPASSHGNESKWRSRLLAAPITQLQGWSVFDEPRPSILSAERRGELAEFHYESLILATGARERFLPFPGWTLPNVMGVGAIQAMMKSGLPLKGKHVVIAGSGPLLLAVAASLKFAGATVLCVCEQAPLNRLLPFAISLASTPLKIAEGLRYKLATWNIPFHTSSWPIAAEGDTQLRSVTLWIGGKVTRIDCDYFACGFHLVPNIELPAVLGCRIENGAVAVDEWQQTSQTYVYCAGEPTGIGGLELSLIEGQIAGLTVASRHQAAKALFARRTHLQGFAARLEHAFAPRPELKTLPQDDTLICRCEDVPMRALRQHTSWRSAKLHTRCGMGPCQGRVCGAATEFLLGWNADSPRPPAFPTLLSSLTPLPADHEKHLETTMKA